jgi:hypothetical protein
MSMGSQNNFSTLPFSLGKHLWMGTSLREQTKQTPPATYQNHGETRSQAQSEHISQQRWVQSSGAGPRLGGMLDSWG